MAATVDLIVDGDIARIQFAADNGVPVLSAAVRDRLETILKELRHRGEIRFVIVQSVGRAFLAGADIRELQTLDRQSAYACSRSGQRVFQRLENLPCLTIAALHGVCAGGGLEVALACDVRLATANCRIGLPEVTLGLSPGWGGTVRLRRIAGAAVAQRMILSGELVSGTDAARLGIVNDVVADDVALAAAVSATISTYRRASPTALSRSKRLLSLQNHEQESRQGNSDGTDYWLEAVEFAANFAQPSSIEGIAAFLGKRPAAWTVDPKIQSATDNK